MLLTVYENIMQEGVLTKLRRPLFVFSVIFIVETMPYWIPSSFF